MTNLTEEEILKIVNDIKTILIKIFANSHKLKKEINRYENSLNFACPYCGDSHKNPTKKRGFLYIDSLLYQCYNEGCRSNLIKLYKDFSIQINHNDLIHFTDIKNEYQIKIKKSQQNYELSDDFFFDIQWLTELCKNQNNELGIKDIRTIKKWSPTWFYLIDERKVYNHSSLLEAKLKNNENVILIFNNYKSKFISLQIRNLKSGQRRFFKNISYTKLYELFYKMEKISVPTEQIENLNKLSNFYNILNVNFELPIYITEGWFDSSFLNNSISLNGLNRDISFLDEFNLDFYFILDYDKAGFDKAKSFLNKNKNVFLWNKFLHDMKLTTHKKWDLNELAKENLNLIPNIPSYFSNSKFDLLYL